MPNESSSRSWTVDVDGSERRVTAETDPESGRTHIRVDGRIAARPLGPADSDRQFSIGSVAYVLRRTDEGEFDLDLDANAPLPAVAPPAYKLKAPKEKPRNLKGVIFGVVLTVLLIPAARWTIDAVQYMRVPWKVHDAPDHRWRISFPSTPEESTKSLGVGGMVLRTVKLQSRYRRHTYVLEWIEFPFYIPPEKESELFSGALDGMVKHEKAELIKKDWSTISLHYSLQFFVRMPKNQDWSGGTARGHIARSGNRLYIVYAYVPPRETLSFDVGEFLRSFRLPDGD